MRKLNEDFEKDMQVHNYSPETIRKYVYSVRLFFDWLSGRGIGDIRKVGRDELRLYSEAMMKNQRFSVGHVASMIRALKCFFRYLKKAKIVLFDFSIMLKEPKKARTLPKEPLTPKEVQMMLDAPDLRTAVGIRDRAIIEAFYSTGLRVLEMTRLTFLDLDLEGGYLTVRLGKGGKDRVVPIGKHACYYLSEYLANVRPILLAANKTPQDEPTNRVWISRRGKPMTKGDIDRVVRVCRIRAGIEKQVTPHSFRRTLAVELIRNECDFLTVKSILGHSKSETTLQYCALAGEELKDALRRCHPRFNAKDENVKPQIEAIGVPDNE